MKNFNHTDLERKLLTALKALKYIEKPCPIIEEKFYDNLTPEQEADLYFESTSRRRTIASEALFEITGEL